MSERALDPRARAFWERQAQRLVWVCSIVLALVALSKPFAGVPLLGELFATLAAGAQLFLPFYFLDRRGLPGSLLGWCAGDLRSQLYGLAFVAALILPATFGAIHLVLIYLTEWAPHVLGLLPRHWQFGPGFPEGVSTLSGFVWWLAKLVVLQVFAVALPEELFFRGYVQPAIAMRLRDRRFWRPALITNLLFALAHFLGEWAPHRLLPFFPGLLFSWFRFRYHSLVGCILLHAISNIFLHLVLLCYRT